MWAATYGETAPGNTLERSCVRDVIETGPDWNTQETRSNGSCINPPQSRFSHGRGKDRSDWITLVEKSSRARFAKSLPPAGRPSRAPRESPFTSLSAETPPHPRRPRRDKIASWLSSQGRAQTTRELVSETAKPRASGIVKNSGGLVDATRRTIGRPSPLYIKVILDHRRCP